MDTLANRATVRMSILSRPSTAARLFFPACLAMHLACSVYVYSIPSEILQNQTLDIVPIMPSSLCRMTTTSSPPRRGSPARKSLCENLPAQNTVPLGRLRVRLVQISLFRSDRFVKYSMKTNQLSGCIANSPEEPALSLPKGTAENIPGCNPGHLYEFCQISKTQNPASRFGFSRPPTRLNLRPHTDSEGLGINPEEDERRRRGTKSGPARTLCH
jgi:hypothetical protein